MYPVAERTLWGNYKVHWAPKPDVPKPRLFIIERYTTCSYLGNYGAGRTVETLSLLPGEQTTISIRTYEDFEETASRSENVVDSFSESSSAELENSLLEETSETTTDDVSSKLNQGGLTIGIPKIFEIKFEAEGDVGASSTRESYAHQIDSAVSRQLSSSSRSRDVSVNVTTSESARSGSEKSITRQLTNINRSRVLNFVFRQLLQEYLTITFLRDVRVVFTNGYPESERVMTIPELADRLPTLVRPEQVEPLLRQILGRYCEVMNHAGVRIPFIEEVNVPASTACGFATGLAAERYFRIRPDVTDSWRGVDVPGVILKARSHILRTRSVIVEALLGQGEALDCYNQSLQAAAVDKADADNARLKAAMLAADAITDPVARARAYVQLVNGCCEEPKSETQE